MSMRWPTAGGFADAFDADRERPRASTSRPTPAAGTRAPSSAPSSSRGWRRRRAAEVSAALKKAGALWAPYQTFRELAADKANVLDNPMFTVLDQPGIGRYPVAATPFQFGAVERQPPQPAPVLGQHTDEILSGILGLGDHEIGRLHDEKVVGGPR